MSEDLAKQLASYKAQLQQVEAALSGNADNEDLLKLKKDLQEVIELTKDLLSTQPSEALASSDSSASALPSHSWKVGDRCMAIWSEDGQCYEAEIEEIDEENGTAAVTFAGYGNAEVTPLFNLKPVEEGRKAKEDSGNKPMSKKEMIAQQREYKKKKALKKAQRIKELEQEREDQKVKWQQFNNRAYSKTKRPVQHLLELRSRGLSKPTKSSYVYGAAHMAVKRSIFASPESVTGKVGVGTCGIADKPMTQYQDTSKYNVRHLMPQ
ncbi:survival of motor neuron-related-splicing factor 30 [Meleagris gallopavo]|uniref:survival of motor neuron-related-splicing factor 30 n=1 Tax=Meleagris gallopavo TaxID=9103 RepID=UPI000549DFF4|nr:survival of motor neuron-related-splicing factor 30 [Meleagris gallopavo]